MRVVLDTNVLVSALFFGGVPRLVLEAWSDDRFELMLTPAIFDEYLATCARLAASRPELEYAEMLATIVGHGTLIADGMVPGSITSDPDDDKFFICARDAGAIIVSGDRHLLEASGWEGVRVLLPRAFLDSIDSRSAS